jgi:hypothetical protein
VGGGVDAEHGGSWRPAARAFGVGREASHVSTLILPLRARLGNPSAPGLLRRFSPRRRSARQLFRALVGRNDSRDPRASCFGLPAPGAASPRRPLRPRPSRALTATRQNECSTENFCANFARAWPVQFQRVRSPTPSLPACRGQSPRNSPVSSNRASPCCAPKCPAYVASCMS